MIARSAAWPVRRMATVTIARRGLLLAGLVFAERLLVPLAAWALLRRTLTEQLGVASAFAVVLSGRTFLQHALRARTEADLLDRLVGHLVRGDVLRGNILPDEDARAELAQAVYHSSQAMAVELPFFAADACAAVLLGVFVLAREPGRVAGVALGVTCVAAVVLLLSRRAMGGALATAWEAQRGAHDGMVDAIEGRLDIVASGRGAAFLEQFATRTRAWAAAGSQVAWEALVANRLPLVGVAALVAVGVALSGAGWRSVLGVSATEIALLASMTPAFSGTAQRAVALARAHRWMAVVARVLDEPLVSSRGSRSPPRRLATIAFDRVSFRYPGTPGVVLCDVSFAWTEGVLAITGANGSGKSTCLRLLLALAAPDQGTIAIDGAPLADLDPNAWRASIGFLPQRPYMPPRSDVRAAIHFLVPAASDDAMRAALQRVDVWSLLEPRGGDPLAVRIDTLSVGARQRVGLARLLCQQAPMVLLDEPDANLDRAGIALVAHLVRELATDARVAVVAHSHDLVDAADRVLVLDGGRLLRDDVRREGEASTIALTVAGPS